MRNELVITGADTQVLLSQTDDGTNTLFINGVEVPQSVWVGEGERAKWTTAEGQLVFIVKVDTADGNLMLTRIDDDVLLVYEFVPYVPFDPSDISNSLVQLNQKVSDVSDSVAQLDERVTNIEESEMHVLQGYYEVLTDGEQHIAIPLQGYDAQNVIVDINGLVCVPYVDFMFTADGKYIDFAYELKAGSIVHAVGFGINKG